MISLALLGLLAAAADQPVFAPVLDKPYRVAFDDQRADPSGVRRFHLDRTVTFSREADGFVAAVTLVAVTTDAEGDIRRHFLIGAGALKGRTIRFHLGPDASVRAIDDEAAIWTAMVEGVAAMQASRSPHAGTVDFAAPLKALSPDKIRSAIASIVTPILAGKPPVPGSRAVALPARPISATGAPITGTQTVTQAVDGTLRATTHAASLQGAVQVVVDDTQVIDAAHGLVLSSDNMQTTRVAGVTQTIHSQVRLTPPV
jgi:hypothetical protein